MHRFVFWCILIGTFLPVISYAQINVGSITIKGDSVLNSTEILRGFDTKPGAPFNQATLERDIDLLISYYETIGYPFAQVSIANIQPAQDTSHSSLDLTVYIVEGQLVHIKEMRPTGNVETSNRVILRETGIGSNEIYNENRVSKIQTRLNRLDIFSQVGKPELTMSDSGGILIIPVQEGNTSTFDGVVGYMPAANGNNGYVTGMVNISMRNLFGTARKLNVQWQRDGNNIQEISTKYLEPWLFNYPVDLGGAFSQRQQDSTYVSHVASLTVDLRFSDQFAISGLLSYSRIIPSVSRTGSYLYSSRTTTTGLQLQYDSRDDIVSPTTGVLFRSDYQTGNKSSSSVKMPEVSSTVQKIGMDVAFLTQPFTRQVISIELHGRELLSNNIGVGEMYRFGGANTLRGFRENQFLGSRIGWTNLEYRFLLSHRSFFFGFFDAGYYFLRDNPMQEIVSAQALKYGYGIGIRVETAIGIVGVSFALGEGDTFSDAKIHFGLVNEF